MKTFGTIMAIVLFFVLLFVFSETCNIANIWTGHVNKSMQDAVVNYDNYQETFNACVKVNKDLGIVQAIPDSDTQFAQFSKAQRVSSLKMKLNGLVEDYNAKSKEIDKNHWKSSELPYQLDVDQFSNYNH